MAYQFDEAAEKVISAGKELIARGLVARTWGNISARLSDTEFLITPSGMAYDDLTPEKLVRVTISDCSYEGDIRPSSEKGVHAMAYRYRSDVDFVIHTHQTMATAVSTLGGDVLDISPEDKEILGRGMICAKYGISSTKPLMKKTGKAIAANLDANAFLMKYHGVLCLGRDYDHAFAISEVMERISRERIGDAIGRKEFSTENLVQAYEKKSGLKKTQGFSEENGSLLLEEMKKRRPGETVFLSQHPVLVGASKNSKSFRPMIDDMAQIVGTEVKSLKPEEMGDWNKKLGNQNALFLQGCGAVIFAKSPDDALAVEQVLEKDLICEMYATLMDAVHPLGRMDAYFQRNVYLKKYSKQMSH